MSKAADPVAEAIDRGTALSERLIGFRDALFEPLAGLLLIGGETGMRASVAGVVEAVIAAHRKRSEAGTVVPFPEDHQ